jgi:tyrosine-protein kinase Etk/Wzc
VDLGQIGFILRRRALTIAMFTIFATCLALFDVLFTIPQFTANGSLYLGDAQTAGAPSTDSSNLNFLSDFASQSDVQTQIELIKAKGLIERAILETGLNATITPAGSPPLTYWRWKLFNGGKTTTFIPDQTTLEALFATTPGKYRIIIGSNNTYKLYIEGGLFHVSRLAFEGVLGSPAAGHGVQMLVEAASDKYHTKPGTEYDLNVVSPNELADSLVDGAALTVQAGGAVTMPTKIASLKIQWSNPYQAQNFINKVMEDYIANQLSWKTQSASTTEQFVKDQLEHVSASLAQADQNLAEYQSKTGIVDVPENARTAIAQLAQYQTQRTNLELQRHALAQLNNDLSNSSNHINPYLVSQTNDNVLSSLTIDLTKAEQKLSQLQVQFTASSQDVQVTQAQIFQLRQAIRTTVRNNLAAANESVKNLDDTISAFQKQIKDMPAESLKIVSLQRSTDVLGQLYVLLMKKQEEAQVSKAATIMNTRIVTAASMPLFATSPKALITIAFGALAGLICGIIFVFGQRAFSSSFESEEQVRLAVNLPVYAAIPRYPQADSVGIFGPPSRNPFSESFRLLRRSIYRGSTPGKAVIIMITSSNKDDGKTTVSVNLAKSLAEDGKKVILVDGDLHNSSIQQLLNFPSAPGLTDWLTTHSRPTLNAWPNENFRVLPAGSMEFLRKGRLDEGSLASIFETLRGEFDYIIVDSPPLPTIADGMMLGTFADLILSVVSVSNTLRRALNIHNELIDTLEKPHGIIINEVEPLHHKISEAYFLGAPTTRNKFLGWFRLDQ